MPNRKLPSISILILLMMPILLAQGVRSQAFPNNSSSGISRVRDYRNITIIYDSTNEIIEMSARRILFMLRTVYPHVYLENVSSYPDMVSALMRGGDIIVLYFNTTPRTIILGKEGTPWRDIVSTLEALTGSEIILLLGNTYTLENKEKEHWHYPEIEYDTPVALEIFCLWVISKIMEKWGERYGEISEKIKEVAVSHYLENAKYLFEAKIKPDVVIGSVDRDYREKKLKEYLARHPSSLRVTAAEKNKEPILHIRSFEKNPEGLWDYLPFPEVSGLSGSVGEFVDKVLEFLVNAGCDFLSINMSVIEEFVNVFRKVIDLIGDPSKLGEGSMLMEFLGLIEDEFPYISDYKKYLDMFIHGFYALKGDLDSILDFFTSVIDLILPQETGSIADIISQLKDIAKEILSIGNTIMNFLGNITKNRIDIVLHYIIEKVSNITMERLLENIPGVSSVEATLQKIYILVDLAFQLFTLGNTTYFVDKLFGFITNMLSGIFDYPDIDDIAGKIRDTVLLVVAYLEKEEVSLRDLAERFTRSFIPEDYLPDNELSSMIGELMSLVDDAIKEGKENIEGFKSQVEAIINDYASSYPEIDKAREIIKETIALITAIANQKFDISQTSGFIEIMKKILSEYMSSYTEDIEKIMTILNATVLPLGVLKAPSRLLKAFLKNVDPLVDMRDDIFGYIINAVSMILEEFEPGIDLSQALGPIRNATAIINGILSFISEVKERPFDGITTALIFVSSITQIELFDNMEIGNLTVFLQALLPDLMGLARNPSLEEAINMVIEALGPLSSNSTIKETVETLLSFLYDIRGVMRDGVKWLTTKILDWIAGYLADFVGDLIDDLEDVIEQYTFLNLAGTMNFGIGGMDALTFSYAIIITAGIDIDENGIKQEIKDMMLKGKYLDFDDFLSVFKELLGKITITPMFEARIQLKSMFSDENEMLQFILESLEVGIEIEGEARFKLVLFSFKSGTFDMSEFFDLKEWYLKFSLTISKTFSIFDLIGAPSLGAVAESLGLDIVTVTISLGLKIEINLGSQSEDSGDHSILSLELTIAGTLHVGFDLVVAEVSIDFTLSISFIFTVDTSLPDPLTFTVKVEYMLKIHAEFLFVGKTWKWGGTIYSYTFPEPGEKPEDYASGFDEDSDGLPDTFEETNFGFSPGINDTDGDGLGDNEELNGYGTDPLDPDTDGDGLSDFDEIVTYGTNPFSRDTDGDRLTDYEEVVIYGTNPHEVDTDGDGLDDNFEVNYIWDISSVTISISGVTIGGQIYYDHTDPLNPDTDGDGLLDGQEGPMGGYYAPAAYEFGDNPIIFNYGYTHPLDNDTDDDSYVQLPDGSIVSPKRFLRSMTDKEEIDGITVVFVDPEEGPVLRTFRTNPVCPDTDQDTGSASVLMSDGYELARDPPTDPLDGDSDDDGIVDGDEGTASAFSNKTDPLNPDTDNDGLGDLQEVLLGIDPTDPDSDGDMVSDGDEVLRFGTSPRLPDTDNDRLSDGEELFFWHSNPMIKDSDCDGIIDGDEVLIYFTDPMDEDSDNDNLTDMMEIFIYHTNPLEADSDYDGILDGEEIFIYRTNPLSWDTDNDSILYPNEYGEMTWPMSDYDEIFVYGTNPMDSDSDNDGLTDAIETYLANGSIPNFRPIYLDPTSNDTDGDGLLDGQELIIYNVCDIIYPYVSLLIVYPLNSSPILSDTDGDGVRDYEEVIIHASNANMTDTDRDGLTDYEEIVVHNTSPIYWDTDKDGISDYDEIHGVSIESKSFGRVYITDPTDPDGDDDFLPDGYEIWILNSNPLEGDENNDGIPDGLERDTDGDGLSDGLEFYVYNTSMYPGGGPLNPDSDCDGLSDGSEVYIYGTDPADPDTDDDGILDGAEVAAGTNPTVYTEWDEYINALYEMLGDKYIAILSPVGTIIDKFVDVRVINGTSFEEMWFRYIKDGEVSENYTLSYDKDSLQWVYSDIVWEHGKYRLEVFGRLPNNTILCESVEFEYPPIEEEIARSNRKWFLIGLAVGAAVMFFILYGVPKILAWRKRRKEEAVEGVEEKIGDKEKVGGDEG